MNTLGKIIKSYIFYTLCALGISLSIIANVGVSSFNSMNLSLANANDIKIGTVTIFFNITFLLIYMILTKFAYKYKYLIQAFSVFMFGTLINYFTYNILGGITDLSYIQGIFVFTGGTLIIGLSIGMIIHYNIITFPMENLCIKISEMSKISFIKLRYSVDIISVSISISVSLMNGLPIYVREGTLISIIFLSSTINFSKNYAEKKKKDKILPFPENFKNT
ncbi:MAG: hypothetical protein WBG30_08005 [Psychrilyobacter sp.]|uniref:hypothetical protein n=1 Tax=Psychrilyobacter sp. TaxID=2586924 RepID=UPI003C7495E7